MKSHPRILVPILFLLPAANFTNAAIIDGFETSFNDRFANDENFIAAEFDLSGVAITENNHWVTMISPNVYVSSNHFKSGAGTPVTFYASNDPNGPSLTRQIGSTSQRVGDSDIWIGILDTPLTLEYAFYGFATQTTTNDNRTPGVGPNSPNDESFINSPYFEEVIFMFGRSPTNWPRSQNIAVGKNVLDRFFTEDDVAGAPGGDIAGTVDIAFAADYNDPNDPNYVPYETRLEVGDSGGPMMVSVNGGLVLVGTNWFIYGQDGEGGTGFAYVGNHSSEIDAFLDEYSLPAIPEPAHFAVLLAGGAALLLLRRRRS